jgi:hypothetical protein
VIAQRVAVGCSDLLDPLVGSKIISFHKLAFSDGVYAALECVLAEVTVSSFDDAIIFASALEKHKCVMVK